METQSFDPILARMTGLRPAIVHETIHHICEEDENTILDRGKAWARPPMSKLRKTSPYMRDDTIARCIKKLRDERYTNVGHHDERNGTANWYAIA